MRDVFSVGWSFKLRPEKLPRKTEQKTSIQAEERALQKAWNLETG